MGHYPVTHIIYHYEDGIHLTAEHSTHNGVAAGNLFNSYKDRGVTFYYLQDEKNKRLVAHTANGKDIHEEMQKAYAKYAEED